MLISYMREDGEELCQDGNYLEHPLLQRGLLWGVARLSRCRPHVLLERGAGPDILPYLGYEPEYTDSELAAADKAVCYGRMGVSTQAFGTLCHWLVQLINLVTGNLDRVGGALCTEPAVDVVASTSGGHFDRWRSRVSGLPEYGGELPVAALAEEILGEGEGQVRALVTVAGNPVLSTPNGRQLEQALDGLEFMVSIDLYINETTRYADLILPSTSALENDHYDTTFNMFAVRNVTRFNRAILPKPEGALHDWEIFVGLAQAFAALGVGVVALDPPGGTASLPELLADIAETRASLDKSGNPTLTALADSLGDGMAALDEATTWLLANYDANPQAAAAGSVPFLKLTGIVVGGWLMARSAAVAAERLEAADGDFYKAKIGTATYFAQHVIPEANSYRDAIVGGAESVLALEEALF